MTWYTRGGRPERNLEAALIGGIGGFLDAVRGGEARPWLRAVTRAAAAASAMDRHRLADRARTHDTNRKFADGATDLLNTLLDTRLAHPALPSRRVAPLISETQPLMARVRTK